MTPARPLELVVGKWLAVVCFNALVVTMTLAGFYLTLSFAPLPPVGVPFLFGAREFGRFLVVLLPMILLIPSRAAVRRQPRAHVQGSAGQCLRAACSS